ncbi:SAF domain-containing protein [Corynebacterium nasicanis]|uniref:SAF domain-containing protein n=1 Tax=Corynebacterium nasicanis TaxID=1448267 RepID=A0ABW1QC54_9CORY
MTAVPSFLSSLRTPGWRRAVLLRRGLAAVLLCAALASALHDVGAGASRALVFSRPVAAGEQISRDDVALVPVPDSLLPSSALVDPTAVEGRILAVEAVAGEVLTTTRLVGTDLSEALVGEVTTIVPVRLAEPEVLPMLRHGDTVTVLSRESERAEPDVIATGGRVILVDTRESPGTLLLGLPEEPAHAVAAASLISPLTVVLASPLPK